MSWKIFIAAVFLLSSNSFASEPGVIRVLSFNLRYINAADSGERSWEARRDAVATLISEDSPDLIGIQEGLRPMLDDLHERNPGFIEIGVAREDGVAKGELSAIFAKASRFSVLKTGTFWLSDTPGTPGSATWENQVPRICTWARLYDRNAGRELVFFNSHFDHRSDQARIKGTRLILKRMADITGNAPVIFTGDFNARPQHPLHEAIRKSPKQLRDVWLEQNPDTLPAESGTVHGFGGRKDGPRIDFIYASDAFRCIAASILHDPVNGRYPSDHYPVRATIAYPEG